MSPAMHNEPVREPKRLAAARARLATLGLQVRELDTGGYWAHCPTRARLCGELVDLETFAREVAENRTGTTA